MSDDRIDAITEDPNCIILAVENQQIKFLHSCKKIGGTRTKPEVTVAGLIGQGAKVLPIDINPDEAAKIKEVMIPSTKRIWNCKISADQKKSTGRKPPPPPAADRRQTRSQRIVFKGAADEATTNDNKVAAESPIGTAGASTKDQPRPSKLPPSSSPSLSWPAQPFKAFPMIPLISSWLSKGLQKISIKVRMESPSEMQLKILPPSVMPQTAPNSSYNGCMLSTSNSLTKQNFQSSRTMKKFRCTHKIAIRIASSPPLSKTSHPVKELRQTKASSNNSSKQQIGTTRCARKPTKCDLRNTSGKRSPTR